MVRHVRTALRALSAEGLQVVHISQGGRHLMLHLADGRKVPVSRGSKVDTNFEKIARDQARRLARQQVRDTATA
jgi:hypothetical protein